MKKNSLHWGAVAANGVGVYCRTDREEMDDMRQPHPSDPGYARTKRMLPGPYRKACFMEIPDDGVPRVALSREEVRTAYEEARRKNPVPSLENFLDEIFGANDGN